MTIPPFDQQTPLRPTPAEVPWQTCTEEGDCLGIQLTSGGPCLVHADSPLRAKVYAQLNGHAPLDMVAGVTFTEELLAELFAHLPRTDDQRILFRNANFQHATLPKLHLQPVRFAGHTSFESTRFTAGAAFRSAHFEDYTEFSRAWFEGFASFPEMVFKSSVSFHKTRFEAGVQFYNMRVYGNARFNGAQFVRGARFDHPRFKGDVEFHEAQFEGDAAFPEAQFGGNLAFDRAVFVRPPVGPVAVGGCLALNEVVFTEPVQLAAAARRLSCRGTRFKAGGHLRVTWAEITLEDAEIGAPLILSAHPPAPELARQVPWLADPHAEDPNQQFPPPMPSLVSVQHADVAQLTATDIDLANCHFAGAHHLDQLIITTARAFRRAPRRLGSGRQVLAEEAEWRSNRRRGRIRAWRQLASHEFRSPMLKDARQPSPRELAGIYRQLRKGREDAKNEPGAASFYYGECEMRRHARSALRAEWWLLTLYWLTSGYALRAWRALTSLVILLVLVTTLLTVWGLPDQTAAANAGSPAQTTPAGASPMPRSAIKDRVTLPRVGTAVYIAVNGAVFRRADAQLTPAGRAAELVDRILGPILLGLVLLSIRNQVKR